MQSISLDMTTGVHTGSRTTLFLMLAKEVLYIFAGSMVRKYIIKLR